MKSNRNFFIPTALFIFITSLVLNGCGAEQTPANLQIGAINTLRTQLELPKTPLEFVEMTTDANSPATMLVAVYQDMDGRRFSVDPVTYQVVEMDARALLAKVSPLATVLSEEQIRTKALRLIAAAIPDFATLQTNWAYEEGGKIDNYFFNWYGEMAAGEFNRPFAQIAIYKTGLVFGYYNTLMLDK
ncbi:MAG: hypothetical protein ABSG01_04910 [Anaerolineales bacterium]|jgi:hypothetical protein